LDRNKREKTVIRSLISWVEKAQSILETLSQPRKIFIASDNHEVIKEFVSYFGEELVSITFNCLVCDGLSFLTLALCSSMCLD